MIEKHRTLYLFEGGLFIFLGILAIALPQLFTYSFELMIGGLFIIGGFIQIVRTFQAKDTPDFFVSLLSGILYLLIGGLLLAFPMAGVMSLTLLLAIFYFVQGIFQISFGFQIKPADRWGWFIFSGVIGILIAVLIWSGWPITAHWFLGLLIGINMIFFGISLISLTLAYSSSNE